MRKFCMIMICFALSISLFGCEYRGYYGRTPCYQPDTEWISEDGNIVIQVDSNKQATGSLWVEDKKIDFIFTTAGPSIYMFMPEAKDRLGLYPEERYEYWIGEFKRDDQFTATVVETTFFTKGDTITFYRVDSTD